MKITILYDNDAWDKRLRPDWGFSCLIEAEGKTILFDTGAKGTILFENIEKLNISPLSVDMIFISHYHWDHTGGLSDFLRLKPETKVYIPDSYAPPDGIKRLFRIKSPVKIEENIFSTGELMNIEQSLIIQQDKGLVLIVGCSHPGLGKILSAASQIGRVNAVVGGLHGFAEFHLLENIETVCATHCTQYKQEIRIRYPEKYIPGGAGKIINL